ncbi:uncharacterized protein LOC116374078 [Oncorhynchus kisutch]|uniref:uncharacterized protein LOC116374078 n=1 Tax=Oncorhynchus kisutch TaxID=8019 RepID=UPI0012DBF658|nr:uncharacterized protein LOC116374078 [Oncorhynchus kisutch]
MFHLLPTHRPIITEYQLKIWTQQDNRTSPRRSMDKVTFFVNTMTSWLNWGRPWKMFSAVHNVSTAEDILEPVYPTSQHTQPIQQPAKVSDARLSLPEKYEGTPFKCRGFLLQCSLYFAHQMGAPTTEMSKVATVISLLTGQALECATAVWEVGEEELESYECLNVFSIIPRVNIPEEYQDLREVFSKTCTTCLPPHCPWDCDIDLFSGATPLRRRIYPLLVSETQAMEDYIQEALQQGFIRSSTSPASAGVFFVANEGGLRPCIDYHGLNGITTKYRYPLPLVLSAIDHLRGARFFTKLDLQSANLIRIREGNEWKTAFSTMSGHYEYLVMPFGLANSPSVFQAFVNEVFRDMLGRQVILYIDDILIFSTNLEDHITRVRAVLELLLANHLFVKVKCQFHQRTVSLGYQITPQGVRTEDKKVDAVRSWPVPTKTKGLQWFLGFANFYHHFIRNFSDAAAPLTSLLKGGPLRLMWSPAAHEAFRLKGRFTSATLLKPPDPTLPFVVEKLSPAERKYDIGDRDLLAVKLALEEWRHWLEGAKEPFVILTDHRNLDYIWTARRLNLCQARWALFFTRLDFMLTYHPGSKNIKADALCHIYDSGEAPVQRAPIIPTSRVVGPVVWDVDVDIRQALAREPAARNCPPARIYSPGMLQQGSSCRFQCLSDLGPIYPLTLLLRHSSSRSYGLPEDIVSDCGPIFTSRVWRTFLEKLGFTPALALWTPAQTAAPAVDEWFRHVEVWNNASVRLQCAVHRQKEHADSHCRETPVFHPGDRVWLSIKNLPLCLPCKKLSPWFARPFKVHRRVNELMLSPTTHLHPTWTSRGAQRMQSDPYWTPIIVGVGSSIWWTGRGMAEERCWVPAEDILDPNICDFHLRRLDRPAPCPLGRPPRRRRPAAGAARRQLQPSPEY